MFFKRILTISPHTDDIELAAGATVAKFIHEGSIVYYAALSDCRDTLKKTKFTPTTLKKECMSALKILGVEKKNVTINSFKNQYFRKFEKEIFIHLEALKNKIKPDLVIIPHLSETHQDHKTAAQQALSVFRRDTSIISFEQPWNNIDFSPNFFVEVSESNLKEKLYALKQYKSQQFFQRPYFDEEFITGLAKTRGIQIKKQFAEAFKVVKLII